MQCALQSHPNNRSAPGAHGLLCHFPSPLGNNQSSDFDRACRCVSLLKKKPNKVRVHVLPWLLHFYIASEVTGASGQVIKPTYFFPGYNDF